MIFNDRLKDRNQFMISLDMKIISAKLKRLPFSYATHTNLNFTALCTLIFSFRSQAVFHSTALKPQQEAITRPIFSPGNDLSSF